MAPESSQFQEKKSVAKREGPAGIHADGGGDLTIENGILFGTPRRRALEGAGERGTWLCWG